MPFQYLNLEQVGLEDIQNLIDTKERENQHIEFKEKVPDFKILAQKLEFLHDVSAFANAGGGDIVYGIKEKRDNKNRATAFPIAMPGLQISNPDYVQRQIEGILYSGLQPSLRGLQFRWLSKPDGSHILILRIPRSWVRPHAVSMNSEFRVSTRTASGKTPLPFKEIADMIIGSNTMIERVRGLRKERIELLKHGDLPINVPPSVVMLQMVPADSFESGNRLSAGLLDESSRRYSCTPLGSRGFLKSRFNFDGVLVTDGKDETKITSYVQYFRSGIIESGSGRLFYKHDDDGILNFDSRNLETVIIYAFKQYLDLQKSLGIGLPIYVLISLCHVKGAIITWSTARHGQRPDPIDREDLILPELIVEDNNIHPATFLRSAFDSIWNAADLPRSLNYNDMGYHEEDHDWLLNR